jgi:hypothetical protein
MSALFFIAFFYTFIRSYSNFTLLSAYIYSIKQIKSL